MELKTSLTIDLLIQATKRQRLTEHVYIAIPKPTFSLHSKRWKDICYLARRLELGLLIVSFRESGTKMDIIFRPEPFNRVKSMGQSKKKRNKIMMEIEGRHANYNIGGSTQTKIMTAYKESCIHIACCLEHFGPLSPKSLRELGTGEKTQSILSENYYAWFDKIKRGTYQISEKGLSEFNENTRITDVYYKLIR